MKKIILNGAIISLILVSLAMTAFTQEITGGYSSASTDDKKVVAAAAFAVKKRAKSNSKDKKIKLGKIETAEIQVVAGLNYKLCLSVTNKTKKQFVNAIVYEDLKQKYSLSSWEVVESCEASEPSAIVMGGKRYKNFVLTNISSNSSLDFRFSEYFFVE